MNLKEQIGFEEIASKPLEKAVLGTILLNPNVISEIDSQPYMFSVYNLVAQELWSHYNDTGEVDANLLAHNCSKKGICSQSEIFSLVANSSLEKINEYAKELKSEWLRRLEINLHQNALAKLQAGADAIDVVLSTESERETLLGFDGDENETRVQQCNNFRDRIALARKNELPIGYTTGFLGLDKLFGRVGLENRYRILAARPAMGKSTLGISIARNAAANGCPTALFMLEMIFDQVAEKIVQQDTAISREDMSMGHVTDAEMNKIDKSIEGLYDLPLFIEDKERDINRIINKIRQLKRKHGVKLVVIDYLQLVDDRSKNYGTMREQKIGEISRKLSELASSEKIDIIALAQLSRDVEKRGGDKIPMLSDLRDSGTLEQDAGQIFFVYRPDYYQILEDEEGNSLLGLTRIIKAKDRYMGKLNSAYLRYNEGRDSFINAGYGKPDDDFVVEESNKVIVDNDSPVYDPIITQRTKLNDDDDIPF